MKEHSHVTGLGIFYSIIAAFGGLLFGYFTGIISGPMLFIDQDMTLKPFQEELIVSTVLIGALIAAWCGGFFTDRFGRKFSLMTSCVLFIVGNFFLTFANGVTELIVGRFISGFGVGLVSMTVPMYIAEMSPAKYRGMFVSFNQLAVVIGILFAFSISYALSLSGNWRGMFAWGFFPCILFLLGLFFIPETPAFLVSKGRGDKAKHLLKKIRPAESFETIFHKEAKITHAHEVKWAHLFDPNVKKAIFVGIGISIFQQITGINIVFYYAPKIFEMAGFSGAPSATLATFGLGVVNVIMTIVALWLLDKAGRKPLLVIGVAGMALSLIALGLTFLMNDGVAVDIMAIISLMFYVSFFAFSLGPIAWLIISEIYPLSIRGRAMGLATFSNWLMNYIVSLSFLSLVGWIGSGGTFLLYAAITILALWFIIKKVPETKGKSLLAIQQYWHKQD